MDIGVFAFIKNNEGKILLVQDATRQELWTLPGGGLEHQELIPDALMREVKEETSLTVQPRDLLGIFTQKKNPGIVILMRAVVIDGSLHADGKEVQKVGFFSLDEIVLMKDLMKPAQLSMIRQISAPDVTFPIFNHFV